MKKCKILKRTMAYVHPDSYGYMATCSCGEQLTGWWPEEAEEEAQKHLTQSHAKR